MANWHVWTVSAWSGDMKIYISSSFVSYENGRLLCKWGVWFWETPRSLRHYGNAYFRGWPFVSRHGKWDCMEMKYNFCLQFLVLLHVTIFGHCFVFFLLPLLWFAPKDLVTPPNSICPKKSFWRFLYLKKSWNRMLCTVCVHGTGKKGGNKLIVLILRPLSYFRNPLVWLNYSPLLFSPFSPLHGITQSEI